MRNIIVLMAMLALSGCATASNCAGWEPINPSRNDTLSESTVKQIVAHNEFGVKQSCWTKP